MQEPEDNQFRVCFAKVAHGVFNFSLGPDHEPGFAAEAWARIWLAHASWAGVKGGSILSSP